MSDASLVVGSGELIGGRYRLEQKIGEGGMASVWRAVDRTLDRPVALKFLWARDPRQRDQLCGAFMREAKIAAAVRHRYVVNILDFGTLGDETPYMVMELLEGENLEQLMQRKGRLPADLVVDMAARVLEGLAAVHEAGIVHRDLKPQNVFIQRERTRTLPKLLDFGISRSVEPEGGRRSALTTQDGRLVGTPEYMSPEQASGEGDVDLRTDLYSLGVIMYEALTGRLPFRADGMGALIVQIITGSYSPVHELAPDVPRALSDFIARAMARDRAARFADAVEMHGALVEVAEACLDGKLVQPISLPPARGISLAGAPTLLGGLGAPQDTPRSELSAKAEPRGRVPRTTQRRRRSLGVAIWLSAIAASAATAVGISYLTRRPEPAAPSQRFILVRETAKPNAADVAGVATAAAAPSGPAATGQPPGAGDAIAAADEQASEEPAARARKPQREAPQVALARTFARHKARIGKCFDPAQEPPTLSLHLALDRAGHVRSVEVAPPAQAGTELGTCVARVARSIEFGPQPQELSLRVPLSVRTERQ